MLVIDIWPKYIIQIKGYRVEEFIKQTSTIMMKLIPFLT